MTDPTLFPLRAGAATADITPEPGISLAGSLTDRRATSLQDPLHARAVVLEAGATRLAFVLLDLIALSNRDADELRQRIAQAAQLPVENVCLSCTHTHFAPGTLELFETPREAEYLQWASERTAEAARRAAETLQPARAAWGIGHEARPQYNRRYHMRDGTVKMNPGADPGIIKPAGPTDPEVPVLLLESRDGALLAAIANYSLHYIGDCDGRAISADYFGRFAAIMRERHGENCVALLTHGASGDINNSNPQRKPEPWYPEKMAPGEKSRIIAAMIADQVDEVRQNAQWHEEVTLAATQSTLPLCVRKLGDDEIEEAQRDWQDETLPLIDRLYAREQLLLLQWPDEIPAVVQALRVGDWAAATMPGELFCQFGLDVKHASPFAVTALIELANGFSGYVPTRYSYELGGYETRLARSAFVAPGSGEELVARAASELRQLAVR